MEMTEQKRTQHLWTSPEVITIIGAILLQSMGAAWWASSLTNRVSTLEVNDIEQRTTNRNRFSTQDARWEVLRTDRERIADRLGRLETGVEGIGKVLSRIEDKLQK